MVLRNMKKSAEMKEEASRLFKAGKLQESIEKFSQCISLDEFNIHFNAICHLNIALALVKQKKNEDALSHLNKAVGLNP